MEWISVKEKLPEHLESCLCYRPDATFDMRRVQLFKHGKFDGVYAVTHWMPLPEPPKE